MSAADGHVVGTTKIVDHGPASRRWNLVILSEGYQNAELAAFHTHADAFVDRLFQTAPYTEVWCALNIFRVDVASTDSGADDPAACGDGSVGSGSTARTFFDAAFCVNNTRRLLAGDQALALATAQAAVPEVHATVVIVNSTLYGGAGGGVAWFSTAADAAEIGIHELGHSAFHLADEYAYLAGGAEAGHDHHPAGEPAEPNVTTNTDRATLKWGALVAATTALPTMRNADCTQPDASPSAVPAGTVGLFEGAHYFHCGAYRPEYSCRMRDLGQPFCAVCRRVIRDALRPFLPKAGAAPVLGVQFTGTVAGGQTTRLFTHDWPACWHVLWTVSPRAPGAAPGPDVQWRVQVQRAARERITYWLSVTNLEAAPVELEVRYAILAKD